MNEDNKRKVFVTQIPNRRAEGGALIPTFNIGPAVEHGEIVVIMPAEANFFNTSEMVKQLRKGLKDYSWARGDSVVCTGDPVIITTTGAILAEMTKNYKLLKWDKMARRYVPIDIHL